MTDKDEVKEVVNDVQAIAKNQLILFGGKGLVGMGCGYIVGRFFKQITDKMILYSGLAVGLIGALNWMHWITINWSEIDEDLLQLYERGKKINKEKGLVKKMKRWFMQTLPLFTGFAGGFKLAFLGSD